MICPLHGLTMPCGIVGCANGTVVSVSIGPFKLGDALAPDWLTRGEKLRAIRATRPLTPAERDELVELTEKAWASLPKQEKPDDPKTLLINEASRPLTTGGDFLDREKRRCCDDALAFGEQLAIKFGTAFAQVALEAALAALKAR